MENESVEQAASLIIQLVGVYVTDQPKSSGEDKTTAAEVQQPQRKKEPGKMKRLWLRLNRRSRRLLTVVVIKSLFWLGEQISTFF